MLLQLYLKNYILINQSEISFKEGFSVFTGQTGAGKSILIEALKLLTGERIDAKTQKDDSAKTIIEATFKTNNNLKPIFSENELDFDEETIIRREISANKRKNRAFINDTPVSLKVLNLISTYLIDIHSQNQTQSLFNQTNQLNIIDAFGNDSSAVENYHVEYKKYDDLHREYNDIIKHQKDNNFDLDYLQFQLDELNQLEFNLNFADLQDELTLIENAETIKESLYFAEQGLENENAVIDQLQTIHFNLVKQTKNSSQINEVANRIESTIIELNDILAEIQNINSEIEYLPEKIEDLRFKIDAYNHLFHKHQKDSIEQLYELKLEIENTINKNQDTSEYLNGLEKKIQEQKVKVLEAGKTLSKERKNRSSKLEIEIQNHLRELSMPNADLKVEISWTEEIKASGLDSIQFLFKANKGSAHQAIDKVVSGGELSRLMLAIKYIQSEYSKMPTLVLDEIDTGISGNISDKAGQLMAKLANKTQVICISHSPQVASKAQHHYKISKTDNEKDTISEIQLLNEEGHINEIAQMLSGNKVTHAAIENAKQLINSN